MKYLLTFNETIELNLSKEVRAKQKKTKINAELNEIFGENVYRLYYDLSTNKQIFPTRKNPKLKLDIDITKKLSNDINNFLSKMNYTLVDLDKNLCLNNKNQKIKITKILKDYNNSLLNDYTAYLDNIVKNTNEKKLYVVISRHSHDIISMGSHENFKTCEDLSGTKFFKQTNMGNDDSPYDGEGVRSYDMIKNGDLIFYLIKENDWNIKNPIGRFASGVYCEQENYGYYGNYSEKFKDFIRNWMPKYKKEILNKYDILNDELYFKNDSWEIVSDLLNYYNSKKIYNFIIKGLFDYQRYDVVERILKQDNPIYFIESINDIFGYKFIKELPENIKNPIYTILKNEFQKQVPVIDNWYDILFNKVQNTIAYETALKMKTFKMLDSYEKLINFFKTTTYSKKPELNKLCKIAEPIKYDQINNKLSMINTIPDNQIYKSLVDKLKEIYNLIYN
jgi:hypothetical protein